jgi:hypothetical protein
MSVGPAAGRHTEASNPPPLAIACGNDRPFNTLPADGPVIIGRELPAHIRIEDPRISRVHVRIETADGGWRVVDLNSTNGTFLDGQPITTAAINDGMEIRLGHPYGIPVVFGFNEPTQLAKPTSMFAQPVSAGDVADDDQTAELSDPALARVGAAVAARREELGYPQRKLSDDKVISQSNLVAFERGRSWPRENTREKLERYLQWPAGTLARMRHGAPAPQAHVPQPNAPQATAPQGNSDDESTAALSDTVQVSMLIEAVELALDGIKARAANLVPPTAPDFTMQINGLLDELRRLQTTTANAARRSKNPAAALLLSDGRRLYSELMLRAAKGPNPPLGARLYAARRGAELGVEETATAAGVDPHVVTDAEGDRPISDGEAAALETLIAQLDRR